MYFGCLYALLWASAMLISSRFWILQAYNETAHRCKVNTAVDSCSKAQFDDEKKAQMLRLMADKITANSHKLDIKGRTKTVRQITIHWNDEFEELFHAGVFKVMDEYRDKFRWLSPPKGGGIHPELLKAKNLSDKNKSIDFLFSIIYLLFII